VKVPSGNKPVHPIPRPFSGFFAEIADRLLIAFGRCLQDAMDVR